MIIKIEKESKWKPKKDVTEETSSNGFDIQEIVDAAIPYVMIFLLGVSIYHLGKAVAYNDILKRALRR